MCRLFGLHAGTEVVSRDVLAARCAGQPVRAESEEPGRHGGGSLRRARPAAAAQEGDAAWQDAAFATEAHRLTGTTFIAHVRYATTGSLDVHNTHPFLQDGRIFAHNGVVEGLDVVDARLREIGTAELVLGQTDSERVSP